jgi:hypothetical protein
MNAGPPRPDDISSRRPRAVLAAWSAAAGVILGTSAVICLAVDAISGQQAVAMALAAALLIIGGLVVAAMPDPATGQRCGFRAGFRAGSLQRRGRGLFRRRRKGDLAGERLVCEVRAPLD